MYTRGKQSDTNVTHNNIDYTSIALSAFSKAKNGLQS